MKKELEKEVQVVENARRHILDSLELELKMIANTFEAMSDREKDVMALQFQQKKQEYLTRQQEFGEDNEQLRANYNQQVLKQINQYVKDFAVQEDYYMILGAEGSGALMYAKENSDVTEAVLTFINNKYKGTK
jgi:Skp family chaperone for outer membrane proteins